MSKEKSYRLSEDKIAVESPEHVHVIYRVAGFGSRSVAYIIDFLLMSVLVMTVSAAVFAIVTSAGGLRKLERAHSSGYDDFLTVLVISIFGLILYLVSWFYFVLFETFWNGRSPGKSITGLKVQLDNGGKITFWASFIRNLLRVADWLPAFYLLGIIVMFFNKRWKRIGDIAAGTIVVMEEKAMAPTSTAPPPPAWHVSFSEQTCRMAGEQFYRLCADFLKRRGRFESEFTEFEVAKKIVDSITYTLPPEEKLKLSDPVLFIEKFVQSCRYYKLYS